MDVKKLVGARIKEYRLKYGYTQAQLAELIEIDNKHLSCIELGKNMPNPQLLLKISNVFNIEIKELFEFYHLQDTTTVKKDIIQTLDKLNSDQLKTTYQYIRAFVM